MHSIRRLFRRIKTLLSNNCIQNTCVSEVPLKKNNGEYIQRRRYSLSFYQQNIRLCTSQKDVDATTTTTTTTVLTPHETKISPNEQKQLLETEKEPLRIFEQTEDESLHKPRNNEEINTINTPQQQSLYRKRSPSTIFTVYYEEESDSNDDDGWFLP